MTKFSLQEHLKMLLVEINLCKEEGDWDRVNQLQMSIDDTTEEIAKIAAWGARRDAINMALDIQQERGE
jgi:hypothetical protein